MAVDGTELEEHRRGEREKVVETVIKHQVQPKCGESAG